MTALDVPNLSVPVTTTITPAGAKRGVIVYTPGLSGSYWTAPPPITDSPAGVLLVNLLLTLANALAGDGWVFLSEPVQDSGYIGTGAAGVLADVSSDPAFGARYLASTQAWWDYTLQYVHRVYGQRIPIVIFGASWGGWRALQVLRYAPTSVVAGFAHIYATILSHINLGGYNFTGVNTTGLDFPAAGLTGVNVPVGLSWHPDDTIVPPADSAAVNTAAVAAGVPVTTFNTNTGNHAMNATDVTNITGWFSNHIDTFCPAIF